MIKLTILGCGNSDGTPMILCGCRVCISKNPRNKRTRQSIYIESKSTKLLVDCGPDIRAQVLANKIKTLDGILITHAHSDHMGGLQDVRPFCVWSNETIDLFSTEAFLSDIKLRFDYLFRNCRVGKDLYRPILKENILKPWVKHQVGDIAFTPFIQKHGSVESLGFLFEGFTYSTDLKSLDQRSIDLIKGTKLWLVDCIGYKRYYPGHLILDEMLALCEQVKPEKAVLIHMSHEIDYETFHKKLPENITVSYDGMKIKI